MLVHVSDPEAILDLSEFLRSRIYAIVERRTETALEVSLIGSYSDKAMKEELRVAIGEWQSVQRPEECRVEIDW